jgi:hypothetical protein
LNVKDTTGKLFNAGTHCNNSYIVDVGADVLCVRLFDPDEEKHVFLNVVVVEKSAVSFRFPQKRFNEI